MKVRVVSANNESLKKMNQEEHNNFQRGKYVLGLLCVVAGLALTTMAIFL